MFFGGDAMVVAEWAAQHDDVTVEDHPRLLVQVAVHAVLARLRVFRTVDDLVRWHELTAPNEAALIRSLLPDAPAALVARIRGAACYLRWRELGDAS